MILTGAGLISVALLSGGAGAQGTPQTVNFVKAAPPPIGIQVWQRVVAARRKCVRSRWRVGQAALDRRPLPHKSQIFVVN